jgi:predicted nucleotidyltransferase
MKHQLADFVDDLRATHRDNLAAVILYGSAVTGDHVRSRSDYNILVALENIGPIDLRKAHAAVREWVRLGHPVPVYFTVSELHDAADVFPIEFLGMERSRRVLYGKDVLAGLQFSNTNLRHQTEYELRSRLIGLRRSYIPASATVDGLKHLMAESISNFAALFAAVLLLKGSDPPVTKREIVARTAQLLGFDGRPFEKVLHIRENNFTEKLDELAANQLFGEYLAGIEKVVDAVDKMED